MKWVKTFAPCFVLGDGPTVYVLAYASNETPARLVFKETNASFHVYDPNNSTHSNAGANKKFTLIS